MFSNFFISRPKFAIVIAVIITLAGLISLDAIPISQYPNVTPPKVTITVNYPGASAQTMVNEIAEPIEEQVNGVPNMLYMQSTSSGTGHYTLSVTFALGSDPNIDQVNVQNRVQVAQAQLPTEVQQEGISVRAAADTFVLAVNLYSPNKKYDQLYISNYAYMHLQQQIARISGVGNTQIFGEREYAMRVWLNPTKMTALGVTASDVISAIQAQNIQVASGQIGEPPTSDDQSQQLSVLAPGELSSPKQFSDIIIRTNTNGGVLHVGDVAKVELAAQQYADSSALDGLPSSTVAIYQAPDANALSVSNAISQQMKTLSAHFPPGLKYKIVYNASNFVRADITEIMHTLGITLLLVIAVVFIFLQDWRATLIPTIAIPVSLIGVFAVLYLLGYSANTIDLFAIVLAITLVVDDAIVVVENVTRHLEENPGIDRREATAAAMGEITGPVVATTLILVAVFAPVGFIAGITGQLYRQFAVTISVSVVISAINALTLSPALCALMLRPPSGRQARVFRWFNGGFNFARDRYTGVVGVLSRRMLLTAVCMIAVFGGTYFFFERTPTAFLPAEDQGYFMLNVQLPDGASLGRTSTVVGQVGAMLRKQPGIAHTLEITGFSIVSGSQESNGGLIIAVMKPWDARGTKEAIPAVMAALKPKLDAIPSADIVSFNPPAIPGISTTGGINFVLEAQSGQSYNQLASVARSLVFAANQNRDLSSVFTGFSANQPQVMVRVNKEKAEMLGVSPETIYDTLEANLGDEFVNDFNYQNFVFQVLVQAQAQFRSKVSDIDNLYVRSSNGAMVPMKGLVDVSMIQGANALTLYNLFPTVLINGAPAAGRSDGQAIDAMEQVAAKHLPKGYGYEWTGMTYQEIEAAGQEGSAFLAAVVFSYLFLAALYESWTMPLSVALSVGFAMLGGLFALYMRGMPLDVYGQVGLVLLIGVAAKNAILIVEFAKDRLEQGGVDAIEAAEDGARTRYRPVMMTALAFIIGVVPLVTASGAGAGARQSIGTTVFGGMIAASVVGVLFIPALFVGFERLSTGTSRLLDRMRGRRRPHPAE